MRPMFRRGTKAGASRRPPDRVAGALAVVLCGGALVAAAAPGSLPPLHLPEEGRWSIATNWHDGWPSAWVHAREDRRETVGGWTLFFGRIELPEGSWILRDAQRPHPEVEGLTELRRRWTSVSVQNMHLDVYGVLCAPALWRLGDLTGHDPYRQLARLMTVSCGQLVDAAGRQGEQIHQTNYAQHYPVNDLASLPGVRGNYVESWDIFWITAHFLTAAAQFEEMGVDWAAW